ncbi:arylesterase [Bacterioplanes sanyensis]|uniref:arylesterase n=1 Tax=Bacterioplanes sanyensis TaxID=1249553 RepID=UPI001E39CF2F|nr:arylesterase [Bacterioplanes sanyensis]
MLALLVAGHAHATKVLIIGDSISAGFGMPVQQGWVALSQATLQRDYPDIRLINASISGDTSAGGRSRLPSLLQQHQPQLVIIELGGNDALRGTPIRVIKDNLAAMIDQSKQAGGDVLLLGMQIPPNYGPAYTQAFAQLFQQLSDDKDTRLVPFLLQDLTDDSGALKAGMIQADGIHPSAKAQPLMAALVNQQIRLWLEAQ